MGFRDKGVGPGFGVFERKSFLHSPEKCCLSYVAFVVDILDISKEMSKNVCIYAHMHTPTHIFKRYAHVRTGSLHVCERGS